MQGRPRRVTGYRLTLWIELTADQERAYRAEHALSPDESLRRHLAERLTDILEGEGQITGWWSITRVR